MPRTTAVALLLLVGTLLVGCDEEATPPAPTDVPGATVQTITTADGQELDARLFTASEDHLVILLHMYPADQTSWFPLAEELQSRGWSALTFDFRGYGASTGDRDPKHADIDARAALDWGHEHGYSHVVLVGASMGGTAALVIAGEASVDGVFTLSAPVSFRGLDAEQGLMDTTAPVRLVAAQGDVSAAQSLHDFADRKGLPAEDTLLTEGHAHGTNLLDDGTGDEVRAMLFDFLAEVWG